MRAVVRHGLGMLRRSEAVSRCSRGVGRDRRAAFGRGHPLRAERLDWPAAETAGGQPISGLRPPRTPAPSRVAATKLGCRRHRRCYGAPSVREPRTVNVGRTAHPTGGRGGPTALGVCAVARAPWMPSCDRKAVRVPGGGAYGRSKRLARLFARGSPRVSPSATTQGMRTAARREESQPDSQAAARKPARHAQLRTPHPRLPLQLLHRPRPVVVQ
jgi:hypothetical protein